MKEIENKPESEGAELDEVRYDAEDFAEEEATPTLTPEECRVRADRIAEILPSKELAKQIVRELDAKLAGDIKLLYVEDQTILAEYFIIATGNTNTQVRSLCGYVEERLQKEGIEPLHLEGFGEGSWVLMDYAGVIVHIFTPQTRQFYNLEKLWAACTELDISEMITSD